MTRDEWRQIVNRINASWPDQQVPAETAAAWYEELAPWSYGDVLLAVRQHLRTSKWRPSVADILEAIDTQDREMAEARRAQLRAAGELEARRHRGTPMPPETREAMRILAEVSRPDTPPERRAEAAAMIGALAGQLDGRAAARPETAADAMRRCPGCATEPVEGFVVGKAGEDARGVEVGTVVPCPDCNPRYEAWRAGTLHLRPAKAKTGVS